MTPPKYPQRPGAARGVSPESLDLQHVIQQQARQVADLERLVQDLQNDKAILEKMFHFPPQFKAGCVEYSSRHPFPFSNVQEILGPNGETYAYGVGAAGQGRASFTTDVNNPTFLPKLSFALIRTAHDNAPNPPINAYLPLSGLSPEGNIQSIPFQYRFRSSAGERPWQSDWLNSVDVDMIQGYQIVCERPLYRDEIIEVEVQPWAQRDDANNEEYRLFCTLHGYKMFEIYPHS